MDEEVEQEEQGEVKETVQHTLEEEDDSEEEELSFQREEKEDLHLGRERHREEEEEEERKMPDKVGFLMMLFPPPLLGTFLSFPAH